MKVHRLDAIHGEGDGALTRFFDNPYQAQIAMNHLMATGWLCDLYDEDVPFSVLGALMLCGPWPVAPTEALVEFVAVKTIGQPCST